MSQVHLSRPSEADHDHAAGPTAPLDGLLPDGGSTPGRPNAAWIRLFDERYGASAFQQLMTFFDKPCVTYARIATEYGVSRERVRQWHLALAPDSPRGHDRRRLCREYRQKRELLTDPVFRAFVRAARTQRPDLAVAPIRSSEGFRKRAVRFGPYVVALRRAGGSVPRSFALTPSRTAADFVFYVLDGSSYLFVPASRVPASGTTFLDSPGSKYQQFRDRFAVSLVETYEAVAR